MKKSVITCLMFTVLLFFSLQSRSESLGQVASKLGVPYVGQWQGWEPSGDVSGEVGHPLRIEGPRGGAGCLPWSVGYIGIETGQLPPGLTIKTNDNDLGDVSGIPTQHGDWVVTLKLKDLKCGGHRYTKQGAPDELLNYIGWENGDKCSESAQGYCMLSVIRFHISELKQVAP